MAETERLAIDGGVPAVTAGPFVWPPEDPAIGEALAAAWRDGDWGRYHGARCKQFQAELAAWHGVEHVHLCSSGTIAVELALRALGIGAGDGVLLAGYDFGGNFRAIEEVGATPVLVDIDPHSWSMDVEGLANAANELAAKNVRAVVVSHLHGGVADMPALCRLANQRGWKIVEDACQAVGASIAGRPIGAWGDIGVLSFGGSKLLTAGRGGALLMNDQAVYQRLRVITGRGNDATPLSDLQAAVLLPQMKTLAEKHAERERQASRLLNQLADYDAALQPIKLRDGASRAYYKFAWLSRLSGENHASRQPIIAALQAEGVPADAGFRGFVSRSERRCQRVGNLKWSAEASQQTILLHHPFLLAGDSAVDQVAAATAKVVAADAG